jgi:hypothetical protein
VEACYNISNKTRDVSKLHIHIQLGTENKIVLGLNTILSCRPGSFRASTARLGRWYVKGPKGKEKDDENYQEYFEERISFQGRYDFSGGAVI